MAQRLHIVGGNAAGVIQLNIPETAGLRNAAGKLGYALQLGGLYLADARDAFHFLWGHGKKVQKVLVPLGQE